MSCSAPKRAMKIRVVQNVDRNLHDWRGSAAAKLFLADGHV